MQGSRIERIAPKKGRVERTQTDFWTLPRVSPSILSFKFYSTKWYITDVCVCVCITNEMNGNAYTSSNLLETWDSEITSNFEITKITFLHQENVVLTTLLKLNRIRTSKEKERNYAFVSLIRNRQICQIISQPVYWIYDFWILMKWLKNVVICRRDRRTSEKWVLSES